jgi:uncharacterized membrane protein
MHSTLTALALVFTTAPAMGQSFTGLGFYSGESASWAEAVSADGSTVVGHGPGAFGSGYNVAWRWRNGQPLQLVNTHADAVSVSADGSVIAGWTVDSPTIFPGYRWTETGGAVGINGLYSAGTPAPNVSGDGHVVVGSSSSGGQGDPIRWTPETGAVAIPNPPLGSLSHVDVMNAFATNADGSVVVGGMSAQIAAQMPFLTPFRWTQSGGTQILLRPDGTYIQGAVALGVSQGGNTVLVGGSMVRRWQESTGIVDIPGLVLNGGQAYPAISGDGNTIISIDRIWNVNTGTQDLTTLLTSAGCNFSGWSGLIATGIDFDGNTICGYGTDPAGLTEAWYATVPAPTSALPLLALPLLARRRRANS